MTNPFIAQLEQAAEEYAQNEGGIRTHKPVFTVDRHLGNPQQYETIVTRSAEAKKHYVDGALWTLHSDLVKGLADACEDYLREIKRHYGNCSAEYSRVANLIAAYESAIKEMERP